MSFYRRPFGRQQAPQAAQPGSPSLTSVLSTDLVSTNDIDNQEWVLFSPQMLPSSAFSELSPSSELQIVDSIQDETADEIEQPEETTPHNSLELPRHNGSGAFDRRDQMERVNMWRLDQSQLVLSELQRIERKFFPRYDTNNENTTLGPQQSLWNRLSRRVMANIESLICMDEEVLDVLFGHKLPESPQMDKLYSERAAKAMPSDAPAWQDAMLSNLFSRLDRKRSPNWDLFYQLLGWKVSVVDPEPLADLCFSPADHWWEDTSSLSTQVF